MDRAILTVDKRIKLNVLIPNGIEMSMISDAQLTKSQPCYFDPFVFGAAKQGNLSAIRKYLEKHQGWIDAPNANGNSMLSIAAKNGKIAVVTYLLEQGAYFYPNLKGKTVYERADARIKRLLEVRTSDRNITPLQLINNKVQSLASDRILPFIASIQPISWRAPISSHYHNPNQRPDITAISLQEFANALNSFQIADRQAMISTFLQAHLYHFVEKDILAFLDLLETNDQITACVALVTTALSSGATLFADQIVQKMHPNCLEYRWLIKHIRCTSSLLTSVNQQMMDTPEVFKTTILSAFAPLDPQSPLSEIVIARGSFDAANSCPPILPQNLRGDMLCYLRFCPELKQAFHQSLEIAQAELEIEMAQFCDCLNTLLSTAEKTKEYQAVSQVVASLPHEYSFYVHRFIAAASKSMCRHGLYKEAYNLIVENRIQRSDSNDVQEAVHYIFQLLEEKRITEWADRFCRLLT